MDQHHPNSSNTRTSDDIESERILRDVMSFLYEIDQADELAASTANDTVPSASNNAANTDTNVAPSFEEFYWYYTGQRTTPALSQRREQYTRTRIPLYARFPTEQSARMNDADKKMPNVYSELLHRYPEKVSDENPNHESLNIAQGHFEGDQDFKYGLYENTNYSDKFQTHQFASIENGVTSQRNTDFNLKTFNEMIPDMMTVGGYYDPEAQLQKIRHLPTGIPVVELERIRKIRQENLNKLLQIYMHINDKPAYIQEPHLRRQPFIMSPIYDTPQFSGAVKRKPGQICTFCKKNGEPCIIYQSHTLKDFFGNLTCPILQKYRCEICGATGQNAHTLRYCPQRPKATETILPPYRLLANGAMSTSHFHK